MMSSQYFPSALNCVRVLTRLLPFMLEDPEDEWVRVNLNKRELPRFLPRDWSLGVGYLGDSFLLNATQTQRRIYVFCCTRSIG